MTRIHFRSDFEVGAVCGKAARTVLCGGRAMKRTSLPLHAPGKADAKQTGLDWSKTESSDVVGSECCVATGDGGCEAYTAIAWGVGLSHEFFFQAEDGIRHHCVTGVQTCALPISDALPGSKATSRAKGSYRNLGDLVSGRRRRVRCRSEERRVGKECGSRSTLHR